MTQEILKAQTPLESFMEAHSSAHLAELLLKISRQSDTSESEKRGALTALQQMELDVEHLKNMLFLFDEKDWLFSLAMPIFASHKENMPDILINYLKNILNVKNQIRFDAYGIPRSVVPQISYLIIAQET